MKIMGNYLKMSHGSRSIRRTLCFVLAAFLFFGGIITGVFAASKGSYVRAERTMEEDEEISVDPTSKGEGYSAVLYNNMNGLPTSEANAIAETDEGFIWIGSYSGLIRYDGNTFERIDSTTGITSVVSLYVDSKDRLWIGTNDNGVAVMERGELTRYGISDGLRSSSIRSIVEGKDGDIYIATTHGLCMVDSDMNLSILDEKQINDEYICELRLAKDGTIYGETLDGALFIIEDHNVTGFFEGSKLGIDNIYTVLPDDDNPEYVYIGTENSKIYYGNLKNGMKDM